MFGSVDAAAEGLRAQGYFVDTHGQPNELDELIRAIRLS